jgi:hypothetical protein
MAIITLITDFGTTDEYVGSIKGVILGIDPAATVVDVTHAIRPQDLAQAAFALEATFRHFPQGTIHVVVVDPGVGTGRKILCLAKHRQLFLAPDNGILTLQLEEGGAAHLRWLENKAFWRPEVSPTFHGRDIIAPVAAHLSRGVDIRALGPELDPAAAVRLELLRPVVREGAGIDGVVVHIDRFGNLITNIPARALEGDRGGEGMHVVVGETWIGAISKTYADVTPGAFLALVGSRGTLEIAVNRGNAQEALGLAAGDPVRVRRPPSADR